MTPTQALRNRLFPVWHAMHDRCTNQNSKRFHRYGGRGVTVCAEWSTFDAFMEWATPRWQPGLQIDRERNHEGYSPDNCRFVTCVVNNQNRDFVKLNPDKVATIKRRILDGARPGPITKEFGVSSCLITNIAAGRKWKNVPPAPETVPV